MARLDRQNALADALRQLGIPLGGNTSVPRVPGMSEPAASWVMSTYRQLGGVLEAPSLQPLGWDIQTVGGLIVELDEEQHFNRYRAETLAMRWSHDLPWREDYLAYCAEFEQVALKHHAGGGFWEGEGSVAQFGKAGRRRSFDDGGSPRWKQRAVYDALRDAAAAAGSVSLARLSVYDRIGSSRLGDALRGHSALDLHALRDLIISRTLGEQAFQGAARPIIDDARPTAPAPEAASAVVARVELARIFEPAELARMLGYHDESRPGYVVRAYLRKRYPDHPKNARWLLNQEQADDVLVNVPRKR